MTTVSAEEFRAWLEGKPVRTAKVSAGKAEMVAAYLPSNYQVTDQSGDYVLIQGVDIAGFTLDGYIIPRLASGLIFAEEIKS